MKKVIFSLCLFLTFLLTADKTVKADNFKNYRIEKCPNSQTVVYKNNKVFAFNGCFWNEWDRYSRWEDNLNDLEKNTQLSSNKIIISVQQGWKRKYASFTEHSYSYCPTLGRNVLPGDIIKNCIEYIFIISVTKNCANYIDLLGNIDYICAEHGYAPKGKELEEIKEKFKPILKKLFKKDETCMLGFKKCNQD